MLLRRGIKKNYKPPGIGTRLCIRLMKKNMMIKEVAE